MHTLTIGRTGSGKTTLWKLKARELIRRGCPVLVCDPLGNDYPAHRRFDNAAELMHAAQKLNHAHLIIDESAATVGRSPGELHWFTTASRNWGHSTHLICQRLTQIDRTMRLQCEGVYVFRSNAEDAKLLAQEFTQPGLADSTELDRFEFIHAGPYQAPTRYVVHPSGVRKVKR